MPTAMPTWLLVGPGRKWQRATRSEKRRSESHLRFSTYSCRKKPMWAMGPPKEVRPRRRATAKIVRRFFRFEPIPSVEFDESFSFIGGFGWMADLDAELF